MNQKSIIFFASILFLLISQGCSSPLEVPANRRIDLEENPYSNPIVKLNPNYLNFDFVHPDSTKTLTIEIENNQDKKYLITNYFLYYGNNNFQILNKEIPIILEPKGLDNSKKKVEIKFIGKSSGVYFDSLILANIFYPIGFLEAKVPYIYMNDYYSNNIPIGKKQQIELTLTNVSENVAIINKVKFSDNLLGFNIKNTLPIELPRNSKKNLILEFTAKQAGQYSTQVQLEIITNSSRKLVDSLSTIKIECN